MMSNTPRALALVLLLSVTGCMPPHRAMVLKPTPSQQRRTQTRFFKTQDKVRILSAASKVLQGMGYSLDETEPVAGLVSASKRESAFNAALALLTFFLGSHGTDKEKVTKVTLLVSAHDAGYRTRITFREIMWNTDERVSWAKTVKKEKTYQVFFDELSKSLSSEAYKL